MLERDVAVGDEARLASHQLEERPVERAGIGIEETDPAEVGLGEQRLDQAREAVRDADVLAEARGVLRDEIQLLDAGVLKLLRLADDGVDAARAELAAHLRNRAERARIRAPLADFDVRVRRAGGEEARQIFVQPHRHLPLHRRGVDVVAAHGARDGFEMIEPDERVDLRNGLLQIGAVLLHHAAADDQPLHAFPFALRDLQDRVDRLLLRRVDEAARIDDDDIGLVEVVRDRDGGITLKLSKHDLGIDEILRTAEGDHADFALRSSGHGVRVTVWQEHLF